MVSAPDSGLSCQGLSLGRGHCFCVLGQDSLLSRGLSPPSKMGSGEFYARGLGGGEEGGGVILAWDRPVAHQDRVESRDTLGLFRTLKLYHPEWRLGLNTNFAKTTLCLMSRCCLFEIQLYLIFFPNFNLHTREFVTTRW